MFAFIDNKIDDPSRIIAGIYPLTNGDTFSANLKVVTNGKLTNVSFTTFDQATND